MTDDWKVRGVSNEDMAREERRVRRYRAEIDRLNRHIDRAFDAACAGDAHEARKHLTDARFGMPDA